MDATELTKILVGIPSITGSEEKILVYLEGILQSIGLDTERQHIDEHRWNLYAGLAAHPKVAFCSHVDTVPPFIPPRCDETHIYGRGSCDTKGIIASMITAAKRLIDEGEHPGLLFVVGEETDSIGAKTVAMTGLRVPFIIVGEPTDNLLARGHKGVLSYTLKTTGKAAHSAYPEMGHSAIDKLLDIIERIRNHDWGQDPLFGDATLNIGVLQGGTAMNVFAPEAMAQIIHRLVDDAELRKAQVHELVRGEADIQFHSTAQPQRLHVLPGFEAKTVHFGTDIPYLASVGRCLLLGPGSIHDAHTPDEKISIEEIETAVNLYCTLYHQLMHEYTS
ncbi:MAG: M20/M25/M40 family metallo-hydrolase [Bacteroidia bacterium]|nr:M20/M25/M40 family metallo-hydrolase [Bacteroidia bacterium]